MLDNQGTAFAALRRPMGSLCQAKIEGHIHSQNLLPCIVIPHRLFNLDEEFQKLQCKSCSSCKY